MGLSHPSQQLDQFAPDDVQVIQLEDSRRLEDQDLNDPTQTRELVVPFVVSNQLDQDLSEQITVLMSLRFSYQVALVAPTPLCADPDEELQDHPEARVGIAVWVKLLQEVDHHSVPTQVQKLLLLLLLLLQLGLPRLRG